MNWKRYSHELIVVLAVLFALFAYGYKHAQRTAMAEENQEMAKEVALFQETVALKKIWADKRIPQKLDNIRKMFPSAKVKWQKKGKKLTASFEGLKPSEVNKLVTKFLNIAVQVELLRVKKNGESYSMEIRCKW